MRKLSFRFVGGVGGGCALLFAMLVMTGVTGAGEARQKRDVLFIAIDDMNDWVSLLDPESPIRTPNLERLAGRGMLFTRAYYADRVAAVDIRGLREQ